MGFSIKLNKVGKKKAPPRGNPKPAPALAFELDHSDTEGKVSIHGFGTRGALSKDAPKPSGPLKIVPQKLSTQVDAEEAARRLLLEGHEDQARVIEQNSGDGRDDPDYDEVPVEEFGAALLRGMGWRGDRSKADVDVSNRQKGVVLGIGAKPLEGDLTEELMGRGKKIEVPLKRVARTEK